MLFKQYFALAMASRPPGSAPAPLHVGLAEESVLPPPLGGLHVPRTHASA